MTAFGNEMHAATVDFQVVLYGSAEHGFTPAADQFDRPGIAYHAPSDARSWVELRHFLDELFRS